MPLEPRTRLGPYEIVASAGAGGMGEVYRGRDTRLGRDVAIKVLPARLAADAAFRQRLEREAQAISSLSHPHICTLYDVGRHDGIDFLVMEYLEGETLAQRLERGPLPLDQVLRYGSEIADALHAAHRRGLVHRDLKPGNVMLTRTGARLLDFGLAKPSAERRPSAESATVAAPVTTDGSIVGTVQYMAPEQIEGRDADARSDIFALGAVLHEMATGRRAFEGQTTASLIAQILEREPPPVSQLQPLSPQGLDDVVKGCLAKDPDERWQTAHDVRLQLVALRRQRPPAVADAGVRRGWRPLVPWALALVLLIVAAAAWMRPGPAVPPSPRALSAPRCCRRPGSRSRRTISPSRPTDSASRSWLPGRTGSAGSGSRRSTRRTRRWCRAATMPTRPSGRPTAARWPSSRNRGCSGSRPMVCRRASSRRRWPAAASCSSPNRAASRAGAATAGRLSISRRTRR